MMRCPPMDADAPCAVVLTLAGKWVIQSDFTLSQLADFTTWLTVSAE